MDAQEEYFSLTENNNRLQNLENSLWQICQELEQARKHVQLNPPLLSNIHISLLDAHMSAMKASMFAEKQLEHFRQAHVGEEFLVFRPEHIKNAVSSDVEPLDFSDIGLN